MKPGQLKEIAKQDEQVATVKFYLPSGEPVTASDGKTEATMGIVGKESHAYRTRKDAISRKLLRGQITFLDPIDNRRNRVAQAAAAVVVWSEAWEDDDGTPLPCTQENVAGFLVTDFMLEQLERYIEGHASFFGKSSAG